MVLESIVEWVYGSGGSLLLHTNWAKMLCAACKGTSDPFELACLLFETFLLLLLICWYFVSVHNLEL